MFCHLKGFMLLLLGRNKCKQGNVNQEVYSRFHICQCLALAEFIL